MVRLYTVGGALRNLWVLYAFVVVQNVCVKPTVCVGTTQVGTLDYCFIGGARAQVHLLSHAWDRQQFIFHRFRKQRWPHCTRLNLEQSVCRIFPVVCCEVSFGAVPGAWTRALCVAVVLPGPLQLDKLCVWITT